MKQWHPLFAQLLRPILEDHFDVQTNVPVGDAPRLADIVLLKRTSIGPLPFQGLWRHLTTWNVLEYKGPNTSARLEDLDRLVEVGLGIHRRFNEQRIREHKRPLTREDVSFWFVSHRLGRRWRKGAESLLGDVQEVGPGLWRSRMLRRPIYLVSGEVLPVERETVPLHLVDEHAPQNELAAARLVAAEDELWRSYGPWVMGLRAAVLEELRTMASKKGNPWGLTFEPMIELMGMDKLLELLGPERIMDQLGAKRIIKHVASSNLGDDLDIDDATLDRIFDRLTPAQRKKLQRRFEKK